MIDIAKFRTPDHPIEALFWRRWSPRAMNGAALPQEKLNSLLEAARWAPSTYNEQEWRFLYAHRGGRFWPAFFGLLMDANKAWCERAGVLVAVLAHRVFSRNGSPNPVHVFDVGAASQNLMLQGAHMGLVVHAMAGFDRDAARKALNVPDDYGVEAMIAIGQPGDPAELPPELRERETPTGRMKIAEFSREGPFAF